MKLRLSLEPRSARVVGVASLALTIVLIVTGCSSPNDAPRSQTPSAGTASPAPVAIPTSAPNDPAARTHVALTRCTATADGWEATGSVTNPGTKPAVYTITVFFSTPHGTVVDWTQTTSTVEPRHTATWTARKEFAASAGTLCVLRGVSASGDK